MLKFNNTVVKSGNKLYYRKLGNPYKQIKYVYFKPVGASKFSKIYQYDSTAPTVNISTVLNAWTQSETFVLEGTMSDTESGINDEIKLEILNNNYEVEKKLMIKVGSNGSFKSDTITLHNGENRFHLYAYDRANNLYQKEFAVYYDTVAPVLTISSPTANQQINGGTINVTISGTASDSQSGIKSVTVNNSAVTVNKDGSFTHTVSVSDTSSILVVATDNTGRTTTRYVKADKKSQAIYKTTYHSSGMTGWNNKYGSQYAPYCDHCGASWGSNGHCNWTTQDYVGTNYWYIMSIT